MGQLLDLMIPRVSSSSPLRYISGVPKLSLHVSVCPDLSVFRAVAFSIHATQWYICLLITLKIAFRTLRNLGSSKKKYGSVADLLLVLIAVSSVQNL